MPQIDPNILQAALAGLEVQRQKLDAQIAEVRRSIGGGGIKRIARPVAPIVRKKRTMSAAAREAIAAAQKKRWAAFRNNKSGK